MKDIESDRFLIAVFTLDLRLHLAVEQEENERPISPESIGPLF